MSLVSSKPRIHLWVSSIVNIDLEMVGTKGNYSPPNLCGIG